MDSRNGTRNGSLWISIVSVFLIVGAVAVALATLQQLPANGSDAAGQGALVEGVTLDISYMTAISQLQGVWYSPDGTRIATLGVYPPCSVKPDQLPACDHGLAIIDAHGTHATERVLPIEFSLGIQSNDRTGNEYVSLYGLGWTPDSAGFGLIYSVFSTPTPQTPNDLLDSGLLLENFNTGQATIIRGDTGYFAALGGLAPDHPIWNIPHEQEQPTLPLTPALAYTWNDTDMPQPAAPAPGPLTKLPPVADSFAPIGSSGGKSPFTIWQPGILIGPGSARLAGQRSAFITTFTAWSNGTANSGQRVGVFTVGVSLPTPAAALSIGGAPANVAAPSLPQPDSLMSAPARDAALTNVLKRIGAYGWALVAWSPAGDALASVTCYDQHGETLELRDTQSGDIIGQQTLPQSHSDPGCRDLAQPQKFGAYPHANLEMAWSPDGSQLALVDSSSATITIWRYMPTR